jgi:hypothetical protein
LIARLGVAVVSLTLFAGVSTAHATPVPIQGLNGVLELPAAKGSMVWTLGQDCISVEAGGWQTTRSRKPNTTTLVQLQTDTVGSMDAAAPAGAVQEKRDLAFGFHNLNAQPDRLLNVWDLGIELRGGRAYLTGRLLKGKPLFAAAKRVRLATIAHPSFVSGNATVPRHPSQTMPDTFLMAIQGNATLAAPLAAALNRIRCHPNKYFAIHPRPVRPGLRFGFVSIQLEPGAAFGVTGNVATSAEFETADNTPLTASATAPATLGKAGIVLPLVDGTHVAMTCRYGGKCAPATDAQLALAGGIAVSSPDGRSATVDAIHLTYAFRATGGSPIPVLAGNVNGQPMQLTTTDGSTPEFRQALSAALGVDVVGAFLDPAPTFTKLTGG